MTTEIKSEQQLVELPKTEISNKSLVSTNNSPAAFSRWAFFFLKLHNLAKLQVVLRSIIYLKSSLFKINFQIAM